MDLWPLARSSLSDGCEAALVSHKLPVLGSKGNFVVQLCKAQAPSFGSCQMGRWGEMGPDHSLGKSQNRRRLFWNLDAKVWGSS